MKRWLIEQFEISRGSGILPLEGLRGFAVFLVFLVHYSSLSTPWTGSAWMELSAGMHGLGNVGVDLFFTLSGYLIYGTLIDRHHNLARFWRRRAQRIYPTFAAVLAIYLVLSLALPSESKLPADRVDATAYVIANALLLPGIFDIEPIITVAWSLSYEAFFYATIPLLVMALRLQSWPARERFVLFAAVAIAGIFGFFPHAPRFTMFVAGILCYEAMAMRWPSPRGTLTAIIASIGLASPLLPAPPWARLALLAAGCCVLTWHCLASRSIVTAAFSWTPLRWLGNMSYSYYLLHGLALKALFMAVGMAIPTSVDLFWPLLIPALIATLIPSAALFVVVERRYSLSTKPSTVPAAVVAVDG